MLEFELPRYTFRVKKQAEKTYILDAYRAKYVRATPEELVRQQMCAYLQNERAYPKTMIFNECVLRINTMNKRCDTVIYSTAHTPIMLIEYKSPDIQISQAVFDQVMLYNRVLQVPYILISNGKQHFCCKLDTDLQQYIFLNEIPVYNNL
ncbi:MAG: type I restriction enzyme HsdR N-terminal domain-containing protein [Paludibacteraceae bacterium]|nr:type I restriction enzyme HsdR N-terminal domain-containing protein [Paludibacteraceae bacterium]MBP8782296.1 type I restriction enzyme HsdR N-terminal domain-containing protein [Paludibacteraceae bacterium]HOR40505.1 type I restriction enzyme HsdR N-terminal domain-containing protein [Paludibacteraceae bacterium]HOU26671.1 type I restriction enzyme HsdR N-terminal domain-containing protein [Paludibacteraceae bacterium]HPL94403.1 type I restriction enzyme HsdR N-terminal domain-containing pr